MQINLHGARYVVVLIFASWPISIVIFLCYKAIMVLHMILLCLYMVIEFELLCGFVATIFKIMQKIGPIIVWIESTIMMPIHLRTTRVNSKGILTVYYVWTLYTRTCNWVYIIYSSYQIFPPILYLNKFLHYRFIQLLMYGSYYYINN
jgi:hypothetical protein